MTAASKKKEGLFCCLCGTLIEPEPVSNWPNGHNAEPLNIGHGRCCTYCNNTKVLPARITQLYAVKRK